MECVLKIRALVLILWNRLSFELLHELLDAQICVDRLRHIQLLSLLFDIITLNLDDVVLSKFGGELNLLPLVIES